MTKWVVTLLLFLGVSGCTTTGLKGSYIERKSVNASVEGILKAFDRVTLGLRGRSSNGREFVSRYQAAEGDSYDSAATSKVRAYARLLILNDRRPYDLQLQVVVEEDTGGGQYEVRETDDDKAEKLMKKLIDTLVSRPGRKDFIDDFRSF